MKKPGKSRPRRKHRKAGHAVAIAVPRHARAALAARAVAQPGNFNVRELLWAPLRSVGALQPAGYAPEDRRTLALLLMPFLIVASALAMTHAWRTTRAYLPEAVVAAPTIELPPAAAIELALPALPAPSPPAYPALTDARIAQPTPPLLRGALAWPPPPPALSAPSQSTIDGERRLAAMMAPSALAWPPALPAMPTMQVPGEPEAGGTCRPQVPALTSSWSPRTSRVTLGSAPTVRGENSQAEFGLQLAQAARAQTNDLVIYSARYQSIAYPLGDVHGLYGACTDVVIRAYRALGVDLQMLVQQAKAGTGDRNIDHRRTQTLRRLFTLAGSALPVSPYPEDYKPGDIVTYYRPHSRVSNAHIAIVSDVLAPTGRPMIVHNRGWGPQLEDALFVDQITGHYRFTPPRSDATASAPLAAAGAPEPTRKHQPARLKRAAAGAAATPPTP